MDTTITRAEILELIALRDQQRQNGSQLTELPLRPQPAEQQERRVPLGFNPRTSTAQIQLVPAA
jgi:hypothetical protein